MVLESADPIWDDLPPDLDAIIRLVGPDEKPPLIDAVFEGGGVKAIAQVGALRAIEGIGFGWNRLAGTSGGAIVASLLAAGVTARRIWEMLTETDLTRLLDVSYLPNVRVIRKFRYFILPLIPNLLVWRGAFEGDAFAELMREYLKINDATGQTRDLLFRDLRLASREPWQSEYRLKIVATDITRRQPVVFPDDAEQYAEYPNRDEMPVYAAVRMSMSIPVAFKPVMLHDRLTGKNCFIVDGGVSSNYPIWMFDRPASAGAPRRPTFGFLLDEGKKNHMTWWTPAGIIWGVVQTAAGAMERRLSAWDEARTIRIPVGGVAGTDFGLSRDKQLRLRDWGYYEAREFLSRFSWNEYLTRFRGAF